MQIDSLKVFCDLAETESFTKSAHINGVTQSAVSQQISALERHFKSLLIERSKKKFRLTRDGELLYDYSKRIVQTFDDLHFKIDELKGVISGSIRVATIYSVGLHGMPPCLKKYIGTHPSVNVHVEYLRFNQVYEDVVSNVVDLGVVAYPHRDHRLTITPLRKEPMVLIVHPSHPNAADQKVRVQSLDGQKFIGYEQDIPTRRGIDKVLQEKRVEVNYVMELDNVETIKRAVETQLGVAIVPKNAVAQEVEKGTLSALEIEDADFSRPLAAIHRKSKLLTPPLKQFIQALKNDL